MSAWAITTTVRLPYLVAIPRICLVASKKPRKNKHRRSKKKERKTMEQSKLFVKNQHKVRADCVYLQDTCNDFTFKRPHSWF